MRFSTKLVSVLLAALMLLAVLPVSASAQSANSGSFSLLNYNVAGLPDFAAMFSGDETLDVAAKEAVIGGLLNESGIDYIAVQEDFNFHRSLVKAMPSYTYSTIHQGGVPIGGGLNIYSKRRIYNVEREEWRQRFGLFDEGDQLTPKGIVYAVIEIADGVYADLYDIHADAFDTEESQQARVSNFLQLFEMIMRHNSDRPILVTGDFNISIHNAPTDPSGEMIRRLFIETLGMKDAWIELHNDGDYSDFSRWKATGLSEWGNWDSMEKVLYKDGNGIHLEPTSFEYVEYVGENGKSLSDHKGAKAVFNYTADDSFRPEAASDFTVESFNLFKEIRRVLTTFFDTLILCLKNLALLKTQRPITD